MGNLYGFALQATAVLGLVVLALSLYALLSRRVSEARQSRVDHLRPRMRAAVEAWLEGRALREEAERVLDEDPRLATGVLLAIASTAGREQQLRLQPLARRIGFEQRALQALARRNPARRARAAVRLGYLGSEAAVPALLHALGDDELDVRLAAAQALVQMQHAPAVVPVLHALALPGRWPLQRATELLVGLGRAAVLPLRQVLGTRDAGPRPGISAASVSLNVLGMLGADEAAPEVLGWLDHPEPEIRVAAARALGGMGARAATPALGRALRDDEWEVRSMAAKSLGQLRDPTAVPALSDALADPAWWVRFNAAQALADCGARGLDALRGAESTHADAFARDISRQTLEERALDGTAPGGRLAPARARARALDDNVVHLREVTA